MLPAKVVVAVAVALAAMVAAKLALKAAQDAHAMARLLHVVAALHKAHAPIAKTAAKEVLRVRHQTASMSAAIVDPIAPMTGPTTAIWTETMTAVPVVMSCHVTSTPS